MKNLIVTTLFYLFFSCENQETNTTAITILADRTDREIAKPEYDAIHPFLNIEDNPNNGIILKLQNIGNTDYNTVQTINIKEGSLLDNSFQRKTEINQFYKATKTLIEKENSENFSYQKSSILYPLIENLKALQEHKGERILVLYSNLAEFSQVYNSYQKNNRRGENPKYVADLIKTKINIPQVKNTMLYIIYYPKTDVQNSNFKFMLSVYEELFKEAGLKLKIGIENQIKY